MEFIENIAICIKGDISINIHNIPLLITKNYTFDELLLRSIRERIEGKCNSTGLVIHETTKILSRNIGHYISESFAGIPSYSISYETKILNPVKGTIIPCHTKMQQK